MRKLTRIGLGVFVLGSGAAQAQAPSIEHQAVGCAVAEKYPRLEARFAPADGVATARVLFQTENAQQWYAVAMKADGAAFSGVLPKPKKSLKAFRYYIEVTDKTLATSRTADYTTNVVAGSSECKGKMMAVALGSASVLLQVPAGAAALPAGFASTGVVAAGSSSAVAATGATAGGGGGLGTGAIAGIVAGAGAVAAGAVVVAGKSGDEGSSAGKSYSGPLTGQYTVTQVAVGNVTNTCSWVRALSGTFRLTLAQSNGSATTGEGEVTVTETEISKTPNCNGSGPGGGTVNFSCAVTGTPGSLSCNEQRTNNMGGFTDTSSFGFAGALGGEVISGIVTYTRSGSGSVNGTATHSGSTTFPVSLR